MFKAQVTVIILAFILGLLAGEHVPNVWRHQAARELLTRGNSGIYDCSSFMNYKTSDPGVNLTISLTNARGEVDSWIDALFERTGAKSQLPLNEISDKELYVAAGFSELYDCARDLARWAIYHGKFKLAAMAADQALAVRSCGRYHANLSQLRLATL